MEVKRNTPGSTKLGCTATLRARLLPTEKGEILEVTIPRYSAHCGHDVGSLPDNIRNGLFDQDAVEAYLKKKQQSDPSFRFFLQKYKSEENMDQQQASRYTKSSH